jgi:hypothetical protein
LNSGTVGFLFCGLGWKFVAFFGACL